MKSFFTKLGTLLLCGVAVAVVGCTDFSQDIREGDEALKGQIEATADNLSKAISGLETQLKADLAALQTTHSTDITKLTAEIEALEDALEAAEQAHATDKAAAEKALADLQTALANAKSALETEIASVKADLQKEIDAAEAAAEAGIKANADGVAANKALIDGLTTQLAALEATVDAINVRLTDTEADVKALQDDLAAFQGDYQMFYSQVVSTIQNHANALSTLEADLEAGDAAVRKYVDTMVEELTKKIETVEQTLTSVNNLLEDEVKARVEGDEELNKKIEDTQKALTNVNNLLEDEVKNRAAADKEIQEYIADLEMRLQNKFTVVDNTLADLNDGLSDLRKELSEEFAAQISVVQNAISSIIIQHNELAEQVNGLDAALKAQTAALQEMKEAYEAKMAELDETDTDLYKQYEGLQEVISTLNNHILDLQAEDEALATSIEGVQEALSQYMRIDAEQTAELKKEIENEITEKFNMLITLLSATEERLTSKVNHIFDRVIANEIKIADLQEQTAELETAITELQDAHALLSSQLDEALRRVNNDIEALKESTSDNATAIDELKDAHALLSAQLEEALGRINGQIEVLQEAVADNKKAIEKNGASIEANKELIAENAAEIVETNAVIAELQAAFEAYKSATDAQFEELWKNHSNLAGSLADHARKLMGIIDETNEKLAQTQKDLTAAIGRIDALEEALETFEALAKEKFEALVAKDFELERKIQIETDLLYTAIKHLSINVSNNTEAIVKLEKAVADANELIDGLRADVDALLARVQSLVYVPEYNDHKATMDWAYINSADGYVIAAKNTVLKYRVHAVANKDAAKAAADIATAWKAKMANLYFDVQNVKVRAAEAALNIVDIKAVGENLEVTVLAKNFSDSFYIGRDAVSNDQGTQKYDDAASYSASLVLTDGNNNRSTEYTNLVPNEPFALTMKLFIPEETDDVDAAGLRMAEANEVIKYLMPCNDTVKVETAVAPVAGFISFDDAIMAARPANQPYFSEDELVALGYDVEVAKVAYLSVGYTGVDRFGEDIDNWGSNFFKIVEDPEFDYSFSVKPGVSFENVDKKNSVKYEYSFNGAKANLTYDFVLSNAQVAVNMSTDIEWTVNLMNSLYDGKNHYAKNYIKSGVQFEAVGGPVSHLTPVLNAPAVMKEGYPKFYVKNAKGEWDEVKDRSFRLAKFNDNATVDIQLDGGTYSWNNSYKIEWLSTNDNENVDYTTTAIVNLVGRPEKTDVTIPVNFVLKGNNSWFEAPADLFTEAYKQGLNKYLGYADETADLAEWKKVFDSLVNRYMDAQIGMPVVNGETSKWVKNLENLATAKLFIGKNKISEKETNVITWSVTPWWGVPINFTVTGDITIPDYEFIYSEDYVKDRKATVYGQIDNNGYSIIKSDLAKYFNLSRKENKGLDGHNWTVDFEVESPVATPEQFVKVGPQTTTTIKEKGGATYHYLASDLVVLDWNSYRGLEVKVNATLKINGYARETLPLTLVTADPLTITGADFTITRELRENLNFQVFEKLVLTSSIKPDDTKANLLQFKNDKGEELEIDDAMTYARNVYGANLKVRLGTAGVYYYNNSGHLIMLGSNKYKYHEETGYLEIYGDDAEVKNYYADFTAILDSRICGGEHQVPFRVTVTLEK